MANWYCNTHGQQFGPIDEPTMLSWIAQGRVGPSDLVWTDGMPQWVPLSSVPSLMARVGPPMMPAPPSPYKSKLAAGLLGILIGSLGIHNFYLGFTGKGVAQLLITVLTCGFGAVISHIWGIIEGIQILTGQINTDADGRPLVD